MCEIGDQEAAPFVAEPVREPEPVKAEPEKVPA
jgi:hypothetical protein